jgi:hypothetical protein|tara:strand:+ start:1495 stop:2037 length:543 start_codon:yes stop_codon:yes gene_type:complete
MARKRGQFEIMGLAIVVILMILGMLFVVRFVLLKPQSTIKQSYADTVLAANLKNSVLLFTTQCGDIRIQDLLKDCVQTPLGQSPEINNCPPGLTNSCDYAQEKIQEIFDATLVQSNRNFRFEACIIKNKACDPGRGIIQMASDPDYDKACAGQEIESKFSPVQTRAGIMKVTLQVCRDVI